MRKSNFGRGRGETEYANAKEHCVSDIVSLLPWAKADFNLITTPPKNTHPISCESNMVSLNINNTKSDILIH